MPDRHDGTDRNPGPLTDAAVEHALAALRPATARSLPAPLRDRLEAALLAETVAPLDAGLHDRLTGVLADPAAVLAGIDAPRPLPPALRESLTTDLARSPGASRAAAPARWRWLGAAAAVLVVAAGVSGVSIAGRAGRVGDVATRPAPPTTLTTLFVPADTAPGSAIGGPTTTRSGRTINGATGGASGLASRTAAAQAAQRFGPPPPFTYPALAGLAASSPDGQGAASPTTRPPQPAVRIGIVGGDRAAEAGFRAYVKLLNNVGGAGGRPFAVVNVDSAHPAGNTVATVNLSAAPIASSGGAPAWAGTPLLETVLAPEAAFRNDVFTFASAAERQAHLIVDALIASGSAGRRVVIYRMAGGLLGNEVPAAMADAVQRRGATPVTVTYDASSPTVLVPGDVALLSLDAPTAAAWFRQVKAQNALPAGGIGGVAPLFDSEVVADLAAGTKVISPYTTAVPDDEATALRANTNRALSASLIHGWVAAKTLAVAVWKRDASTAPAVQAGLSALESEHFSSNWGPAYSVRPNTRSRTPEGVLLEVVNGAFVARGGFRTDPF